MRVADCIGFEAIVNHQFKVPAASMHTRKSNYSFIESVRGKYEFEEFKFYEENCIKGSANDKFIKVFRTETGQIKHICLIDRENSNSILLQ